MPSPVDMVIIVLTIALPLLFWFRESLPFIGSRPRTVPVEEKKSAGASGAYDGDERDFVEKMEKMVSI